MRVMVLVKADKDSEAGVLPNEQILTEMGKFNEELVKAGVMLAGEGLHPSSKGVRVRSEARTEFERAAALTRNFREREVLLDRAARCGRQARA